MSMPDDEPTMLGLPAYARQTWRDAPWALNHTLSEQCMAGAHKACREGFYGCGCNCHERTW